MKGIVTHLECDTRIVDNSVDVPWNFGADGRGQGKTMLLFLRHTQDYLEQASDRLTLLDELGRNFVASCERLRSDFLNKVLFVLTAMTALFLPAQFLAGVYGMNFED